MNGVLSTRHLSLDIHALASALAIDEDNVIDSFRDGRVASRFTEHWAEEMFGVCKYSDTNHPHSDAFILLPDNSTFEVAIRCLTFSGIKFQASRHQGAGRTCSTTHVKNSIRSVDRWIVFDMRSFPKVTASMLRVALLEEWIDQGHLTIAGLTAKKFDWLTLPESAAQLQMAV